MRINCGVSTVNRAWPTVTTALGSATGLSAAGTETSLRCAAAAAPLGSCPACARTNPAPPHPNATAAIATHPEKDTHASPHSFSIGKGTTARGSPPQRGAHPRSALQIRSRHRAFRRYHELSATDQRGSMTPSIFISAGEASGEHYGALLASALSHKSAPKGETAELWGMGGPRMAAAGVELIVRAEDMAVMGLTEVVLHLPRIYREFRKLKRAIRAHPPTVAILIDFPEINFRLAREFHRLGVPVIYFVSPQLWAWKQHRIKLVREYVRRMLVIFPFEEPYYRARGVDAEFVGHPLADLPQPSITREQFAADNNLDPARTWIGLLPGSRMNEIQDQPARDAQAAAILLGARYEYILPLRAHDSSSRSARHVLESSISAAPASHAPHQRSTRRGAFRPPRWPRRPRRPLPCPRLHRCQRHGHR